jgi:methylmalonyl-CoA epimerase
VKLEHIGIAVRSLEQALKFYRDTLGLRVAGIETIAGEKVRVAMLPLGETRLELLEPTADDSVIAAFLEKRGEGIHHIALGVEQLDRHLKTLAAAGARILPGKSRYGASGHRYAFLHPSSCGGVLVELVEVKVAKEA